MSNRWPDGYFEKNIADRVEAVGHRQYVGGFSEKLWYEIGKLQYHFLISEGLEPRHVFFDVACGSLRLGQYLIPYLQDGRYHGIDLDQSLIDKGLAEEFYANIIAMRNPRFYVNDSFDLGDAPNFDYAIAQSLFTHLTAEDIGNCLLSMRKKCNDHSKFYFTFFERQSDKQTNPDGPSDPNRNWFYSREEIESLGAKTGWHCDYIGEWQHPAGQRIVRARPAGR
ncbi:MAG: hypothetical protein C0606_06555 [Hyphomicrobiales bacterium]|nr:MAG: hypothetical protein C0606_06555 [Hyphomicrobiales bacterium]